MRIEILGMGCPKCRATEKLVLEVIRERGIDAEITKVTDIAEIIGFGVMMTPAVAIDGKVKVSGRIPSKKEIEDLLVESNKA
jgi:small redox-active disulfide protein 2